MKKQIQASKDCLFLDPSILGVSAGRLWGVGETITT